VWGYFPLEIAGSDGTLLCPVEVNDECSFWRGKLPLTQEYFIKVKAVHKQRPFGSAHPYVQAESQKLKM
ncbi:MAG: hypothetical protein KKD21_00400, partial [Proteobacteria bacterium]|nr:hypothetical protein [Pseudomonadota bacterium]